MISRRQITSRQALDRLRDLCSRSEHCTAEIAKKLYSWGIGPTDSEKIIAFLCRDRYIDDERFAHAFVRDKFYFNHWGRLKIRAALAAKRIDRPTADSAMDEEITETDYEASLLTLLKAKARSIKASPDDYDSLSKLIRFAVARGYESARVITLVKSRRLWDEEL